MVRKEIISAENAPWHLNTSKFPAALIDQQAVPLVKRVPYRRRSSLFLDTLSATKEVNSPAKPPIPRYEHSAGALTGQTCANISKRIVASPNKKKISERRHIAETCEKIEVNLHI